MTGEDAPNTYGILPVGHDETALAVGKVRYVGDHVACVAAVSEEIAERALELIDVEYEPLPAYFDPEQSMKAESDLIHENRPNNIEKDYHHVFGDPEKGFAEADYVAEGRYIANEVTHAAMEPHSTLANFELDPHTGKLGRLTVWSSTQVPYYLQHKLSLVLELPMSQIRVIKPLVGGGFGGQERNHPAGDYRGGDRARGEGSGKDHLHARRSFLGASRTSADHHRPEDRREEGRSRDRSGLQGHSGRRRLLLLRCGNDFVFGRAAGGPVRHSSHPLRRLSCADQQACLRRDARTRHGQRALCLRIADGRDLRQAESRSGDRAAQEPAQAADHHRERPARFELRLAGMHRQGD